MRYSLWKIKKPREKQTTRLFSIVDVNEGNYISTIILHSFAQFWHSVAHFLQWSSLNIPHSSAHSSQIVSHSLHKSAACLESIDMNDDASLQMHAHSLRVAIQFFLAWTSDSFKQSFVHSSHAWAHRLQASMHFWDLSVIFVMIPIVTSFHVAVSFFLLFLIVGPHR